ncbi:MAG: TRAP transporter large permease subunit [Candidatus Goldbacteria bacterium]|nr:TRAP transporter large permease subunit [Candidatus Goldiibacteriota bacterium]
MTIIVIIGLIAAFLGVPLFIILGGLAFIFFMLAGIDISAVIIETARIGTSPVLITIPLFTFAGYIMAEAGTPRRMINLVNSFIGWLRGGVAIVAIVASTFFTAFTGATGVTIIALGGLLFPMLLNQRYNEKSSLGIVTSAGTMGVLFPPSIAIILYGLIAKVSIAKLFIAGILPGILLTIMISILSMKYAPTVEDKRKFSLKEIIKSVKEAAWEIPLPFIVLWGIYSGKFTAAEAAIITATYAFVVEVFIYRDLHIKKDVPRVIRASIVLTGGIFIILGAALGLTNYLIDEQVPMKMFNWIKANIGNKYVFLILLNIFLLIVGCLMDIFSAIMVVVPLIAPVALNFGIDPTHLGIIFLANLGIGYLTPPVGLNLFIASYRFRKPVINLYIAVIPFLLVLLVGLIIITYIPFISLCLVDLFKVK